MTDLKKPPVFSLGQIAAFLSTDLFLAYLYQFRLNSGSREEYLLFACNAVVSTVAAYSISGMAKRHAIPIFGGVFLAVQLLGYLYQVSRVLSHQGLGAVAVSLTIATLVEAVQCAGGIAVACVLRKRVHRKPARRVGI